MKLLRPFLSWIGMLILLLLVFLAYGSVNNRFYRVVTVEGELMAPTLRYGDMMVVTPHREPILLDSIIVMNVDGSLVTHRVVGFDEVGLPVTKGDANELIDHFGNPNQSIVGIYRLRLPYMGYPLLFITNLVAKI